MPDVDPSLETPADLTPPVDAKPVDAKPVDAKPVDAKPASTPEPEAWRETLAGDDEKLQKLAARYTSPKAVLEALAAAQSKIRSGGAKAPLKADATPEELTAWREENGIPAEPAGYEIKLSDGLVLGETDKPLVDGFLAKMHAKNAPPELVNEAVTWFLTQQEELLAARDAADDSAAQAAKEELQEEYGRQYKVLLAAATQLIPEDLRDAFLEARLDTGERLGNNAGVMRWLAGLATELNPAVTVVPGSGTNAAQAIETELNSLKKLMGDRTSTYWKGPESTKMQARYRELISTMSRIK